MSDQGINDLAWKFGWNPIIPGLIGAVVGAVVYYQTESPQVSAVLGLVVLVGLWYWGIQEVNNNYQHLRNDFYERSIARSEEKIGLDQSEILDVFNFRSFYGGSPPFIEPVKQYQFDHMALTDVSTSVDIGSLYDMEERSEKNTGTINEIYYDNIENIRTNDEGLNTDIIIKVSAGDPIVTATSDKGEAEQAQRVLRDKMREVRREAHH